MSKDNNLHDFLQDVADAIKEKKGSNEPINAQNFADEIKNLPSGSAPRWTGHADVEGLKAIGWDDDDIAYYQEHGVNWNEEDDEYHKVSDDNKALYGVLNINNISTYKDRIVYLPKINITKTTLVNFFYDCRALVAIPKLDTSKVTNMSGMFYNCFSLVAIPELDTSKVTNMNGMFQQCRSLLYVPPLDTSLVQNMGIMFYNCPSITNLPDFDTTQATAIGAMFNGAYSLIHMPTMDTSECTDISNFFWNCTSLVSAKLNLSRVSTMNDIFRDCSALVTVELEALSFSVSLSKVALLSKESLLYIINNATPPESGITITLEATAYARLAEDADIVAALKGKKITLGK